RYDILKMDASCLGNFSIAVYNNSNSCAFVISAERSSEEWMSSSMPSLRNEIWFLGDCEKCRQALRVTIYRNALIFSELRNVSPASHNLIKLSLTISSAASLFLTIEYAKYRS